MEQNIKTTVKYRAANDE